MPKLPVLSGKEMIKVLNNIGFQFIKQKGSHAKMRKITGTEKRTVIIPLHVKELRSGTLKSILRQAGITREELEKLI